MKKLILFVLIFSSHAVFAQEKTEAKIQSNINALNKAMLAADEKILSDLTSDKLSYGHSAGNVEDKKEFIRKITSKEVVYETINASDQVLSVSGDVVVVRMTQTIQARSSTTGSVSLRLHVLQVWQKQNENWKLLTRQGVKLDPK